MRNEGESVKMRVTLILLLLGGIATVAVGGGNADACPPCPPAPGTAANATECSWRGAARDECFYTVRGGALTLQAAGNYYLLTCPNNVTLDDTAVPRLTSRRAAPKTVLERCAPPRGPYSAALLALNVTVLDELVLSRVSARAALRSDHLTGLPQLQRLVLTAGAGGEPLNAPSSMLAELTALTHLQLSDVTLGEEGLMALPMSLKSLHLSECGLSSIPESALSRLTQLTRLTLDEPRLTSLPPLSAARALTAITVGAPLQALPPLNMLINATIGGALDVRLPRGCGSLQRLNVFNAAVTLLPVNWLLTGECGKLRELRVMSLRHLTEVNDRALSGAANLTVLTISGCPRLTALPAALLITLRHLTTLDLSRNGLTTLPDGVFSALTSLQYLDVSQNHLSSGVLNALAALPALTTLRAGHNPIGDLCAPTVGDNGEQGPSLLQSTHLSPLSLLTSLQSLSLPATGARRVCADWRRQLVRLKDVDLKGNNLTVITFQDLRWERPHDVKVSVDLRDNPISHAVLSAAEYAHLSGGRRASVTADGDVSVTLRVDAFVQCDCSAYWMARAAAEHLLPAALLDTRCRGQGGQRAVLLEQVDLTTMVCEDETQCSAECSCKWRPHDDTLLVSCASLSGANRYNNDTTSNSNNVTWPLHAVSATRVELDLSNTNISRLPETPLPMSVRRLNVSHNALSDVTMLLTRDDVTFRLQHNPLLCDCIQVKDFHRHRNQIEDFDNVTCSDGTLLTSLTPQEHCGVTGGVGVAAAVVGMAALTAGAALLARRLLQRRIKAALRKRRYKHQPEPHYTYDGFLAFSHHDSELAERVIESLEGGASGLRLCVHHRDWMPGEWVPTAITRSVECSRRTVALVSRHFAASVWARAELRQAAARAAAGRGPGPVLVLLGHVPKDMRAHVRQHRALRWDDPRIWDKLRRLLAPNPNTVQANNQCTTVVTAPSA